MKATTKKNNTIRVNDMPIGTLIGYNNNFGYLGRNAEKEAEIRATGHYCVMVDALCRRCGSKKTYRLNNLRSGATKTCGCGRKKNKDINLNQLIDDADRRIDDKAEIKADTPQKRKTVPTESETGNSQYRDAEEIGGLIELENLDNAITGIENPEARQKAEKYLNDCVTRISFKGEGVEKVVLARGKDEDWIKTELSHDPTIAKTLRDTAYVADGKILGKTLDHIGENQLKSSDLATEVECDGYMALVHEEYDGCGHESNQKTIERDEAVMLDCINYNLGVLRIATQLPAFHNRDAETVLAVRQALLNAIRANVAYNAKVGANERPVVVKVTRRGAVEEVVIENGKLAYKKIGRISDFIATCC